MNVFMKRIRGEPIEESQKGIKSQHQAQGRMVMSRSMAGRSSVNKKRDTKKLEKIEKKEETIFKVIKTERSELEERQMNKKVNKRPRDSKTEKSEKV